MTSDQAAGGSNPSGRATLNEFEPPCPDATSLRSNIRASRASSSAIAWRRERLSDIGQGLSLSVSTRLLAEVEHPFDETDYVCLDLVIGAPQEEVGDATGASAVVIEEIAPQHLDCLFCLGVS